MQHRRETASHLNCSIRQMTVESYRDMVIVAESDIAVLETNGEAATRPIYGTVISDVGIWGDVPHTIHA